MASRIESIDVNVPLSTAYNQWTQFEEFPRFMEGVKSVTQIDDSHLHWVAEVGGRARVGRGHHRAASRRARRLARDGGTQNAGVVTFHRFDDNTTRVTLQMDYEPEGLSRTSALRFGVLDRRVEGDLTALQGVRRGPRLGDRRLAR